MTIETGILLSNSEATAEAIRAAVEPNMIMSLGSMFVGVLFVLGLLWFIGLMFSKLFEKRETKEYREKIADMYVVGIIKKFAKSDSVDVEEELAKFDKDKYKSKKERKRSMQELDETVESHLQEAVDAHTEKKLQEIKDSL